MLPKRSLRYVLLMLTLTVTGCSKLSPIEGKVEKGYIDLASWDFKQPVSLQGEWMFFWGEELEPADVLKRMEAGRVSYAMTGLS